MKKNIEKINPDSVVTILKKITSGNINSSIKNSKFVIDCSDNFKTRFLVNEYCFKEKKILVSAALQNFDVQIASFKSWAIKIML